MPNRAFAEEKATHDGHALRLFRISCRCGETDTFPIQGKPPVAAEQHWRRAGWTIGSTMKKDRCPSCSRKPRLVSSFDEIPALIPMETTPMAELNLVQSEPPASPTRDDRRVIFAKLEEVYVDETSGYSHGWSDHRVSLDLGVPRAWVAMIRSENFGDAKDNEEVRQLMQELAKVQPQVDALASRAAQLMRESSDLLKKSQLALDSANALALRIKELERIAKPLRELVPR